MIFNDAKDWAFNGFNTLEFLIDVTLLVSKGLRVEDDESSGMTEMAANRMAIEMVYHVKGLKFSKTELLREMERLGHPTNAPNH